MQSETKKVVEGLFVLPDGALNEGYLLGSKCQYCGTFMFPKRPVCPKCMKDGCMSEIPLSKKGRLHTFSVNLMAPEGFEAPYITGQIDLPEKIRIFSVITGCEPREDALEIGMEMELIFEPLTKDKDGNDLIGYKFKPVKS